MDATQPLAPSLVISGMMGTGKTTVGREVARVLGAAFIDLDEEIASAAGMSVAEVFARDGEPGFRAREREAVQRLVDSPGAVIATGGFTLGDAASGELLRSLGPVVVLTAMPATLALRLSLRSPQPPLEDGSLAAITALAEQRRGVYDAFALQVATDCLTATQVAERVIRIAGLSVAPLSVPVGTPTGGYRVLIGEGTLDAAGTLLAAIRAPGRAIVVTDRLVGRHYLPRLRRSLQAAGFKVGSAFLPRGEPGKTLGQVAGLYDVFLAKRLERGDLIVALGGGAVGDAAGFAAATFLRGLALVHVPTTLLAMLDSAIGGKTGVNLAAGKNLVGAFHDPLLVLADPTVLASLPPDRYREGLAEALKAGLIGDPDLFALLESGVADPDSVVGPAVAVKARIVSSDPRESGPREWLNLGHTFAHGIEGAGAYRIAHGEAVAVGLVASARLGARLGVSPDGLARRIEAAVERLGLPAAAKVDPGAVLEAMAVDKKRIGGRLRFVVPRGVGDVVVTHDVPERIVREVLATVAVGRAAEPVSLKENRS